MPFNGAFGGVGMRLAEGIGFGGPGRFCEDVVPLAIRIDPVNAHFLCGGYRFYWGGFGVRCNLREVGSIGIECLDGCDGIDLVGIPDVGGEFCFSHLTLCVYYVIIAKDAFSFCLIPEGGLLSLGSVFGTAFFLL